MCQDKKLNQHFLTIHCDLLHPSYDVLIALIYCADNGDLSILYDVPKSWVKWDEERRQKWLDKNYDKINKEFNDAMYVSASYGYYDDIE